MRVGVALGSNLNDRLQLLRAARSCLHALHEQDQPFLSSRIYETEPVDCPSGSPLFLNAAIEMHSSLPPGDLLARLQLIERQLGRPHTHDFHAPRPIDLDLLYCDDLQVCLPNLALPHPRIAARPFVLAPLLDICPERIPPGWKLSFAARLAEFSEEEIPSAIAVF
jgi:2-amino-4-hydroxy-6-hydroxymethyldihydropteridine diphosphokinase